MNRKEKSNNTTRVWNSQSRNSSTTQAKHKNTPFSNSNKFSDVPNTTSNIVPANPNSTATDNYEAKFKEIDDRDSMDEKMGFYRYDEGPAKTGWLVNMHATLVRDDEWPGGLAACDYYFLEADGNAFKSTLVYNPYFYLICKASKEAEVEEHLRRKHEQLILNIEWIEKEDLNMLNHLSGLKRTALKLSFRNVSDLLNVRKDILLALKTYKNLKSDTEIYDPSMNVQLGAKKVIKKTQSKSQDPLVYIEDIREYDVPYYLRVAMDNDFRVGVWYKVNAENGKIEMTVLHDKVLPADPVILAFDIETTKLPLKFPDASFDQIMMISYVVDGQGYLITNRQIVSEDIKDFEYTPKPEFEGPFVVFNEVDELALLNRFFEHILEIKPHVFVTYNGDFFDWPFVEARAEVHGLSMKEIIGVYRDENDEYKSYSAHHSDCLRWVKRDSYLPAGSHGLKAVTTSKLGYNPMELDPEVMVQYAQEHPQILAQYSVSDAVATYYLYMKYVHPFIFSLCNVIPMNPDEVLRKGSGTLCESLLMVQAYKAKVIMPNKRLEEEMKFHKGHLLTSETYVGGHVEALKAGVFRSDLPLDFHISQEAISQLIQDVPRALNFSLQMEHGVDPEDVENLNDVQSDILNLLKQLKDKPVRSECPLIYHLDVAAMYPNIILTNRLQPDAMVTPDVCASCDFNSPENQCKRALPWSWRGEFYPSTKSDILMIQTQLASETSWAELPPTQKQALLIKRIAEYSRKIYKRLYEHEVILKSSTVCQRENSFYIDTVQNFRDRRYEYKAMLKKWKQKLDLAKEQGDTTGVAEAKKMMVVMDSLQLAHKCILNSFYGYVMRKGSRWYSMEMGGIVCYTGSKIIQLARELIEKVGIPLELDTDGIWCALPKTFPENFTFRLKNSDKSIFVSYPCMMLNHLVHEKFTNHQYQIKDPITGNYSIVSKNSIFFEIDGPYRAMILPASTEENRLLKKRYAVFHPNGSLAELKGFEVKRRGELKLIKIFQSQIFSVFLKGSTLEECYKYVAQIANEWLDILDEKGGTMSDSELLDLISENKSMSKSLTEYGELKSTAITTAKRLAEFLGENIVKDKLACHFIIANQPPGAPVAERAIPVAILHSEPTLRAHYLSKWLKNPSLESTDIRNILDWDYYKERFGGVLQKLITIPASRQNISNPIPRVKQPDWVVRKATSDKQQSKLTDLFDIEDMRMAAAKTHNVERLKPVTPKADRPLKVQKSSTVSIPSLIQSLKQTLSSLTCPDPTLDYKGWLSYQKHKWKYQRCVKKQERSKYKSSSTLDHSSSLSLTKDFGNHSTSVSLGRFLQGSTSTLKNQTWQILQIKESSLGLFKAWVIVGFQLHQIQISVPRLFYVHSNVPIPSDQASFLNYVKMSESKKTLPRQIPVLFLYECIMEESDYQRYQRALSTFFNHPSIQGAYETQLPLLTRAILHLGAMCRLESSSSLKQLNSFSLFDIKTTSSTQYLESSSLEDIFIFHYGSKDRHFLVVFSLKETKEVYIFICDPSGRNQISGLDSFYNNIAQGNPLLPQAKSFEISIYKSEIQLWVSLNKYLEKLHREKTSSLLLTIQSNQMPSIEMVKAIHLFPYLTRPWECYQLQLPALDWQRYLLKTWSDQLISFPSWKLGLIEMAKYANVPLCHLTVDPYVSMLDILFARKLLKSDHVLWYSEEPRPDLGGREVDDHLSTLDMGTRFPEINQPGLYSGVSVDVELFGLAIAALLDFSNNNFITLAVKTLVSLVRELGIQARAGLTVSDSLLVHIYRWLMDPKAALYDPMNASSLLNQMQKVFMELITILKKNNATIAYASLHRVVFLTPKATITLAKPHLKYLFQHLSEHSTFLPITFRPGFLWGPLLWIDTSNYGGVLLGPFDETIDYIHETTGFQLYLHLTEFLPPPHANTLLSLLSAYFDSHVKASAGEKSSFLLSTYQHKVLESLPYLQKLEHGIDGLQCPTPIGSHLDPISPTILMVQLLCGLLALDKDLEDSIMLLKRHAMGLLQVSSFASISEFKQPCFPIVLHQVMCRSCFFLRNVDLTREPHPWSCPCGATYDLQEIESLLLRLLETKLLSLSLQDLVCKLCGSMKREHMGANCTCGGQYEVTVDRLSYKTWLKVVKQLATNFDFVYLKELLDFAIIIS